MRKLIFPTSLFLCISILVSCLDEFDFNLDKISTNTEQNTNLAIPLVDASITVDELLSSDSSIEKHLIIDNDNFITLRYQFEYDAFAASNFFNGNYSGANLPYITDNFPSQIVNIGFDKLINHGQLYFYDPSITISVVNYWNVPTRFKFNEFKYYEQANSPGTSVTGSILSQWIDIDQPSAPGLSATTDIVLDSTNCNIDDVLSALPHHLSFGADYETIPGGPYNIDPTTTDSVLVQVDLPLNVWVTDLLFTDTIAFNLGDKVNQDTASVDSIKLNLIFDNGFPLNLSAQIYLTDTNYVHIDTLFHNSDLTSLEIPSATVVGGIVTESSQITFPIIIEKDRMQNLFDAKFIILSSTFSTFNASQGQTVKIYSNYALGLKVGALVSLHLKI